MLIGGVIVIAIILGVSAFILWGDKIPVSPDRPYKAVTPTVAPELTHAAEQMDEPEYSICPSCGNKSLEEWVGEWSEQFGQGEIIHQGVSQWRCRICGHGGFQT